MITEEFLRDICPNHTDKSKWNKSELIHILEAYKNELGKLQLDDVNHSFPTEEQVLKTIFDCVFIRGIELEDYKRNFTNEQSGLYDALVKLFGSNDR